MYLITVEITEKHIFELSSKTSKENLEPEILAYAEAIAEDTDAKINIIEVEEIEVN